MIEIDGTPPPLAGRICEELLCQQYWQKGRLADEADVVLLKCDGVWHQLYLDGGMVHWAPQAGEPETRRPSGNGIFSYPLEDFGARFKVRGEVIDGYRVEETEGGEIVSLQFTSGATVQFTNRGDNTSIDFIT